MVTALFMVAALQTGAPSTEAPVCSLVTPRSDVVGFQVIPWNSEGDYIGLISTAGSVWPPRTVPGSSIALEPAPQGKSWFAFGGADGLVLELTDAEPGSDRRTATLRRRNGRRATVPLAFGFCEPGPRPNVYRAMDPNADPSEIGADIDAFDPRQWPEGDCGLLFSDGRRTRFRFRLTGSDRAEFSSPDLWSGDRVTAPIRWLRPVDGVQRGAFGRRGGPAERRR